jgi:hypothetical protein
MNRHVHDRLAVAASAVVVVLAIGLLAGPVAAHGPDPVLAGKPFTQDQVLKFSWRTGSEPVTSIASAVKAAAADATSTRASRAATFAYVASGGNAIGYGAGATCGVNGLACFSRDAPNGFTMWLREQGHVFDWGSLKWCQTYKVAPTGCYDAETIALDEFGHVEGLDHHVNDADGGDYGDAVVQTYSRTKPKVGWDMHAFGVCDVATLQLVYDVTSWAAPYSTCNQLDTTLSVLAPTTVTYGTSVTLIATLKVTDEDAYQRLGANPVSGRLVTLQTRAPGATTWLSAGTMATGVTSGTYAITLRLTADIQVRGVFKASAAEGLVGSLSPVVTIDVGACRIAPCPQIVGVIR